MPGHDQEGVIGFHELADVETMLAASRQCRSAVVIGGGLLGLEAANGLMKNGMDVTMVHLLDTLMEVQTTEITDDERVQGVHLTDGSTVEDDLVVRTSTSITDNGLPQVEVSRCFFGRGERI